MERHVVIGTAGHIDHGKTTLVKALTGVDTDRLAEEKARGITIDLGFAPLDLDGVRASVVDVPGHEGFIRNMLAGATGVDLALLVVAADEGVMPQTREHLAILRHLGVERGIVALTKCDLAPDAGWLALVRDDVAQLIEAELGRVWPVVEVSVANGLGLDRLRAVLAAEAKHVGARSVDDVFRMPVDRVFALAGAGTIATGTVWSGGVAEGETVTILPGGRSARLRSVQVHGASALRADAGRRAALALVGVARDEASRGTVIVTGEGWRASRAIDVAVTLAKGTSLKLRSRVRVHHGTAEVMGRVARLGDAEDGILPMRLRLDGELVARAGDRLVLRSYSPVTTIGGGVITDPWAERLPGRRRRSEPPARPGGDGADLVRLVTRRGGLGMTRSELHVAAGMSVARLTALLDRMHELGLAGRDGWFVSRTEIDAAAQRMRLALAAFHRDHPLEPGMSAQAWRGAALAEREALADLAQALLEEEGEAVRSGSLVHRPGWNPGAGDEAAATQERVIGLLRMAGGEAPSAPEVAAALPGMDVPGVLRMLVRGGRVVQVADRYYVKEALEDERERLASILKELGPSTPAVIRERMGRSRKWLIPLLEWADREGLTVRTGDRRALRNAGNA